MTREIARLSLDASRVQSLMDQAAAGADPETIGAFLQDAAGADEMGADEMGADELGALADDLRQLQIAAQQAGISGEEFGASVDQLLASAVSGEDFGAEDFAGADDAAGAWWEAPQVKAAMARARARRRPGRPVRPGIRPGFSNPAPAVMAAAQRINMLTKDMRKAISRSGPGEGPHCPLPVNLPGGVNDTVAAGASVTINARPPRDFVTTGIVLPRNFSERFVLSAINVENDSLLANTGFLPGELFAPDSNQNAIPRRLVRGGRDISLTFINVTAAPSQLWGAILGDEGDVEKRGLVR